MDKEFIYVGDFNNEYQNLLCIMEKLLNRMSGAGIEIIIEK
jgi:hypothetical protein